MRKSEVSLTRPRLTKHDRYVQELQERIRGDYSAIFTQVPLSNEKRSLGEIDLLAFNKRGYIDLYEVKCSRRIVKARKQLRRIKRLLRTKYANTYLYCGSSREIEAVIV
jgi:hypothetical protein